MRKTYRSLLLICSLFILLSCSKDDEGPFTGDLKIVLNSSLPITPSYELYTEASWSATTPVLPLVQGQFTSANTVVIRDLNPGNYILLISGMYKQVQVTAGREREYTI